MQQFSLSYRMPIENINFKQNRSPNVKRSMPLISLVLSLLLLINPLLFEATAWATEVQNVVAAIANNSDQSADKTLSKTSDATDQAVSDTTVANIKLQNTKKVKTNWKTKLAGANEKIHRANSALDNGKRQTQQATAQAKSASAQVKQTIGSQAKGKGGTFGLLTKFAAGAQKALIKTGQMLQKIGKLLKTVGQALQVIGKVLSAIPWTSAIGVMLTNVGSILQKVGGALDAIGQVIENIGQTAVKADANFGDMLKQVFNAGKKGWIQGGKDAEAFQKNLDNEAKTAVTSNNMSQGSASQATTSDTGLDSSTVKDVSQDAISDM